MKVGRARTLRPDLPPGLIFDSEWQTYHFRGTRGGERLYVPFGKIGREAAIKAYWKVVGPQEEASPTGTVGELINRYLREELPRRLRIGRMKPITAMEYERIGPTLRQAFGKFKLARTAAESGRHDVLRTLDVDQYLRKREGARGAVQANREIAVMSAIFAFGRRCGMANYNPCEGAERNTEQARKRVLSGELRTQIMAVASPALRLMCELSDVTSMRKTDVRLLMLSKVRDDEILVESSKTGIKRAYEITPAVRAVLEAAATLPGRKISLYVFPTRKGTPFSESALQTLWKRAKEKAGLADVDMTFRDFRTTALNEARRTGQSAKDLAGHADERTTERHYLDEPLKVKPLR
jgi:integrase